MTYLSQLKDGKREALEITPSFAKEYDVIVCGLGTSGSLAALFCAENGLSVLGVESFTCVGGNHTAGGIGGHYFGCPGGRYRALDDKVKKFSDTHNCIPHESRKMLAEEALLESGVEILFDTTVCGIYLEDKTAVGLRVLTREGITSYGAKVLLDCTADAHVAVMAGCETEYGRKTDRQTQPYTLTSLTLGERKYRFSNMDFGRVDPSKQWELTEAILFARSYKAEEEHRGRAFIAQSPLLGIREGRRIVPEETVRLADLFADKQTETPMFYSYSDLDKHGWDIAFDGENLGDWAIGANLGAYNVTVAVPYRAILPKGYEGILVPCRALGVDRDISSCVRMNLDMKKLAEVAAEWVTLAVKENKKLREISYEVLKEKLIQSTCLDEAYNRGYRVDGRKNWDGSPLVKRDVTWITEPEKLAEVLQTDTPGQGIWSAKRMGEKAISALRQAIAEKDEVLRKHASFAIASLGRKDANEILRDMVIQRDGFMLKDCRKNNNLRGCMAIYWLGRLFDREITEELIRLICDPDETHRAVYHQNDLQTTRYKVSDYKDIYFQFISQSVMALIRIGDAHADLRPQIKAAFENAFSTDDYYHRITQKPKLSSEGNMVQAIKTVAFSSVSRW